MNSFFTIVLIGISFSMDAFSLSLIYGMSKITKSQKIFLSLIVGIYHFFMPLIGLQFGNIINNLNIISLDLIASLILAYIGFDLIRSNYKNYSSKSLRIISYFISNNISKNQPQICKS